MTGHIRKNCRVPRCNKCRRFGHIQDDSVRTYATIANMGAIEEDSEIMDEAEAEEAAGSSLATLKNVTPLVPGDKVPTPSKSCLKPVAVPDKCDDALQESTPEKDEASRVSEAQPVLKEEKSLHNESDHTSSLVQK